MSIVRKFGYDRCDISTAGGFISFFISQFANVVRSMAVTL